MRGFVPFKNKSHTPSKEAERELGNIVMVILAIPLLLLLWTFIERFF